jgi:hypothetical protein
VINHSRLRQTGTTWGNDDRGEAATARGQST